MTDLLPIVFQLGQNEGIDPRVAPTDTHVRASNVRWRKDGRPAKRYGSAAIDTTSLDQSVGYSTKCANALAQWQNEPLLIVGSGVRPYLPSTSSLWPSVPYLGAGEISHWGPGERNTIAQGELQTLASCSVGYCNGIVLHMWEASGSLYYSIKDTSGSVILAPTLFQASASYPRIISCTNLMHILYKSGTSLIVRSFDPTTLNPGVNVAVGTLNASTNFYDAAGRGSDFVIAFQNGASTLQAKLFTSVATPVNTQTQGITMSAAQQAKIGVGAAAGAGVWVAWLEGASGKLQCTAFNNAMTSVVGNSTVDLDSNNTTQPGLLVQNSVTAQLVWGGYVSADLSAFTKTALLNSAGASTLGTGLCYNVSPASKPFSGPAADPTLPLDNSYVWVTDANSEDSNTQWDTQRTYHLMKFEPGLVSANNPVLRRMLHTPNVVASTLPTRDHLSDVVNMGNGFGFLTDMPNAVRFGNGAPETYSIDAIGFRSIFENQRQAARDVIVAGRALQISGGSLFEYTGVAEETGFSNAPVIKSITGTTGGAMTPSAGNYIYQAVFEWLDQQGRRHRSAPSDPFTFTPGTNTAAVLTLKSLIARSRLVTAFGSVVIHLYRTLNGQSTFHRVTPNVGAPIAVPGSNAVSYTDRMSDASAATQEVLYTDGGVVPNSLPPPSTFLAVCNARVWLGGQLDRTVITASKILVDGEPTQFSDEFEFSVFLPEKCTGLASLDGTLVAFARERIYLVTGDGPSDEGVGGFNPPTELPTDVGCVDWRSIVETSQGVFFQSKRGIYLLPRGFNTPVFVGLPVEATLATYPIIQSATLVSQPSASSDFLGEVTVRFVAAADESGSLSEVLVYDLRTGGWSVDGGNASSSYGIGGVWSDAFVVTQLSGAGVFAGLQQERIGSYADIGNQFISSGFKTGDIRPFGLGGFGQFKTVLVVGEYRGNADVFVNLWVDGEQTDNVTFVVTGADAGDGVVYLEVSPSKQQGCSLAVQVGDGSVTFPDTPTEGFLVQGIFVEYETIGKTKRLAAARRA